MDRFEELKNVIENKQIHYTSYNIKKRSGGYRRITTPNKFLKRVQQEILFDILNFVKIDNHAMGFVQGRSIYSNAKKHIDSVCIVRIDLKDFFPSVKKEMIIKSLEGKVSAPHAIAEIVTVNNCLPQGAPTSPCISNIVCIELDKKLTNLAAKFHARYTRYADDIVFSSKTNKQLDKIIPKAHSFILHQGFDINYKKLQIMRRGGRQMVTGIVVNDGINVPRTRVRNLRAEIHKKKYTGVTLDEKARLAGVISFVYGANKEKGQKLYDDIDKLQVIKRT